MATKAPAIGIDLGTTNSCVAVYRKGKVEIIANDLGNRTTPSWVAFTDLERLVGEAAMNQVAVNHSNTVYDVKRLIGRKFEEDYVEADMRHWPFEVINDNSTPKIKVTFRGSEEIYCPEQISSIVLTKMKETAEAFLGMPVEDAVITVPAYFNHFQRLATKNAGDIAGLNVLSIITEPIAASIAYVLEKEIVGKRNVLIYDLGGGTFDVTILTIDGGSNEVLSINGDTHLGGGDFDCQMVNHCVEDFKKNHKIDIATDKKALTKLRTHCERAKKDLSNASQTSIVIDSLHKGIDYQTKILRAQFEDLNAKLFLSTLDLLTKCLEDANKKKADIDEIVMVGGSTRIPKIQKLIKEYFNRTELNMCLNPDEAVAYGAAVQADILTGHNSSYLTVYDVTPLSLGIDATGGVMSIVVKRNTLIPTTKTIDYQTSCDNQTVFTFRVYQGERPLVRENIKIGCFSLNNIPPKPRGEVKVSVTFTIDANGIIVVSAMVKMTQLKVSLTIEKERGRLTHEDLRRMTSEAEKHRQDDEIIRNAISAKNTLRDYCNELKAVLIGKEHGLSVKIHEIILNHCNATIDWVELDQLFKKEEYETKQKDLEAGYKRGISIGDGQCGIL